MPWFEDIHQNERIRKMLLTTLWSEYKSGGDKRLLRLWSLPLMIFKWVVALYCHLLAVWTKHRPEPHISQKIVREGHLSNSAKCLQLVQSKAFETCTYLEEKSTSVALND